MVKPQIAGDENSEQMVRESQLWKPPIPPSQKKTQDTTLEKLNTRINNIKKDSAPFPGITEEILEQLLGTDNLAAQEGEQKYYILPDQIALQKLMNSMQAVTSGDFTQNRWWHKTNVEVSNGEEQQSWSQIENHLQNMEERLRKIEQLLLGNSFSAEK